MGFLRPNITSQDMPVAFKTIPMFDPVDAVLAEIVTISGMVG